MPLKALLRGPEVGETGGEVGAGQPPRVHPIQLDGVVPADRAGAPKARKLALVGHPNVGKSVIFSRLTGSYVTCSNYPGTTVQIYRGSAEIDERHAQAQAFEDALAWPLAGLLQDRAQVEFTHAAQDYFVQRRIVFQDQ